MGGGDDGVGGGGVNGRMDWWNNLVMCGGGCREGVGRVMCITIGTNALCGANLQGQGSALGLGYWVL